MTTWTLPPVTPAHSSSFTEKSGEQQQKDDVPSDNVFAALVLRQVHMRKKAASMQQSRRKPAASSSSTGESQKLLSNEWSSFIYKSAASAAPAVDRAAERSLELDMRTGRVSKSKSRQRMQADLDLLVYGPWDRMIHDRRRRVKQESAAQVAPEKAAVLATECPSDSDSDSAEIPSWAPPDKERPSPPPMPPHWHAYRQREQKRAMERERDSQRAQRQREQEREAFQREHHQMEEEESAWEERQQRPRSQSGRPHSSGTEHSPEPQEPKETSNISSDDIPLASGVWRPWHFPFFARSSGHGKGGGRRSWVSRWRWGNARVSPEPESGPCAEEGAADPVVELAAEDLIADIDDELDRSRGQPLQERRRIFRELQRRLHPDKNPSNQESSKFAFQYLMDSRQSYFR
eukprot:TRINITY_DN18975_c0_g1_i1.p1 TRINITY_DN18975_c0_g1~~TRINITY_DN18975_c0_g1_i1.p1  ORF type:complete len:404 (-),score=69.71 TRINITY_DN18975_c0_g1_i1:17-1228(-)